MSLLPQLLFVIPQGKLNFHVGLLFHRVPEADGSPALFGFRKDQTKFLFRFFNPNPLKERLRNKEFDFLNGNRCFLVGLETESSEFQLSFSMQLVRNEVLGFGSIR